MDGKEMRDTRIKVNLTEENSDKLREAAIRLGKSVTQIINEIVKDVTIHYPERLYMLPKNEVQKNS